MNICKNVNMVFYTINAIEVTILISYYPCYVGVELFGMFLPDSGLTIMCSEHNVIDKLAIT